MLRIMWPELKMDISTVGECLSYVALVAVAMV